MSGRNRPARERRAIASTVSVLGAGLIGSIGRSVVTADHSEIRFSPTA